QEQSLHFVPKIVAMLLALLVLGAWMLTVLKEFAIRMFENMLKFIGM
ncbi:MAG TPA: EscS/YscS/HrcS family type III secretion system export apparatus protein, partial [Clostridiaceae bacterium]|nr:EscS/YscS/HrcS family type III secretion system export apparatus protein [Clostridiaceae bacterium]